MKADIREAAGRFLVKNKILLLLLVAGVVLLVLPNSGGTPVAEASTEEEVRLQGALSRMTGVGDVYVLLAEERGRNGTYIGAIVVCEGAGSAGVRLNVVETVSAFTGLGSNRILVLKMKE